MGLCQNIIHAYRFVRVTPLVGKMSIEQKVYQNFRLFCGEQMWFYGFISLKDALLLSFYMSRAIFYLFMILFDANLVF